MNIWQSIISVVIDVLKSVVELFPLADENTLSLYTEKVELFRSYLAQANWLFPVSDFFTILSAILTIEFALFTYRFVKFIVKNVSFGIFKC